jgi:hypothetical protein
MATAKKSAALDLEKRFAALEAQAAAAEKRAADAEARAAAAEKAAADEKATAAAATKKAAAAKPVGFHEMDVEPADAARGIVAHARAFCVSTGKAWTWVFSRAKSNGSIYWKENFDARTIQVPNYGGKGLRTIPIGGFDTTPLVAEKAQLWRMENPEVWAAAARWTRATRERLEGAAAAAAAADAPADDASDGAAADDAATMF